MPMKIVPSSIVGHELPFVIVHHHGDNDIPSLVGRFRQQADAEAFVSGYANLAKEDLTRMKLADVERIVIEATVARCGNRDRAAAELGIGVRTLSGKLREYGWAPRQQFPPERKATA